MSRPVRAATAWAWRFLVLAVATALVFYLVFRFRLVFFPVIVALLLTALLDPTAARLRRRGMPSAPAAAVVFVGGIALVLGVLVLMGSVLASGLEGVTGALSEGIDDVRRWLTDGPLGLGAQQIRDVVDELQQAIVRNRERLTSQALTTAAAALQFMAGALIAIFVTFFFLYDGARIWGWCVRLFPRHVQADVAGAGAAVWQTLVAYVRGTVIVALFDGTFIALALIFIGVPVALSFPLGVIVFFGAFVPLVGAFVTGVVAVFVAFVVEGPLGALLAFGAIVAVQQIEGNILQPFVLGRLVRVHPVAVVLVVTWGTLVAGIAGAIIAVPIAAVANTALSYFAGVSAARHSRTGSGPGQGASPTPQPGTPRP
ncbi:MAG: AI-2E family transporter [Streptomycetales bacterium]